MAEWEEEPNLLPRVNQIIYLSLDKGENYNLKSRVADINKNGISINLPIEIDSGRVINIEQGTEVKVLYTSNDLGQFIFETKLIGKEKDQVALIILERPSNFDRIQRRDYIRVPTSVETSFKIKNHEDEGWHITKTSDLSGGGMQLLLHTASKVATNQFIEGWLVLPYNNGAIEHIKYQGKIVRAQLNKITSSAWLSIQFLEFEEHVREKIIRYCFEKQVEMRKKQGKK